MLKLYPGDLQKHLQTMFTVLRPEDTIRLVSNTQTPDTHTIAKGQLSRGDIMIREIVLQTEELVSILR